MEADGSVLTAATGTCTNCVDEYCKTCTINTACATCEPGFFVDTVCKNCITVAASGGAYPGNRSDWGCDDCTGST